MRLVVIITILFVMISTTLARNIVWRDERTFWEDTLQKNPRQSRGYREFGRYLFKQGEIKNARSYLEMALSLDPLDSITLNILAIVYFDLSDFEKSEYFARLALNADPKSAEAFNTLGEISLKKGLLEDALRSFLRASDIYPKPVRYYNIAFTLEHLGRINEACMYWTRYINARNEPVPQDAEEVKAHIRELQCLR